MDGVSIISLNGKTPVIHPTAFVAPGCRLIGDIEIGPDSSIWYNCVLRADVNFIRIGARTNIQDGTVIHVDSPRLPGDAGQPTIIGDDVLIGHMAMVHGCVLEDRAFVGLGAIVMDGGHIESDGMLAAGAMMTPGKHIGAGELWAGRPAKLLRMLSDAERAGNQLGVAHYVENARMHRAANGG
ncbi:MAG: gamma carbonic anhydrase family protein [Sphingomonas sanxanigenens]|uniref:Gamma carbonic anhydrase family protein n=1 Tax=Sphingomonas sanxanigenens TaxID=397260 RepID=A0A2W5A9Q4_9SPHN|nr:MAG: gamma carbonic anhydrase family protein [Sphingomonas sanxanigenens]